MVLLSLRESKILQRVWGGQLLVWRNGVTYILVHMR
jgi:hypothetical protein